MSISRKKILFICGSLNQTSQLHQISQYLPDYEHAFTPYFCDGFTEWVRKVKLAEMTVLGNELKQRCLNYLTSNNLNIDWKGEHETYDLVVTCSDLVIPETIRDKKIVLVQEGMTDPERFWFFVWRFLPFLPRWSASTGSNGMSRMYDLFCVASEGYKDFFIQRKGARPESIVVTGIPNFDNMNKYLNNSFPYKNFVLVCTSDARDTYTYENRKKTILHAVRIANGRQLIFKLHPNENKKRAKREIQRWAPTALIYDTGSAEEMIANCDVLITQFSTTVYTGIALGKEVYSYFDVNELKKMCPIQNNSAAKLIAEQIQELIESPEVPRKKSEWIDSFSNPKIFLPFRFFFMGLGKVLGKTS